MKKIICDIAFAFDCIQTNGMVHTDKFERVEVEITGDRPSFSEIEKQVLMPRYDYDVPQYVGVSVHWDDQQSALACILQDLTYKSFGTCLISYTEA